MRLICPNCGAQYEVPDDVIPEAGRDVQCSNCGNTWYERPGESVADEEAIDGVTETATPAPDLEPEAEPEPEEEEEDVYDDTAPEPDYDYDDAADDEEGDIGGPSDMETAELEPEEGDAHVEEIPAAVGALARRRSLDPSLANILREEADREEEVRRREPAAPIETQTEMELDRNDPQAEEAERRKARLMGEPEPAKNGPRRELLPDIEEINSTLRPATERPAGSSAVETTQQAQKRGFRSGFLGIILIAVIGAALYVFADTAKTTVPAAAPLLDSYVIWVDGLRGQLHELVSSLSSQLGG